MNDLTQIYERLSGIEQKVESGFHGTNRRLDILNGKVAEHERRLNASDVADSRTATIDGIRSKWWDRFLSMLAQTVFTATCVIIVLFLTNSGILNLEQEPDTLPEAAAKAFELQEVVDELAEEKAEGERLQVDAEKITQ